MTIKDLQARRNDLAAEMRRMADTLTGDKTKFSAEEEQNWKKVNDDYNECCRNITIKETADKAHVETTAPAGNTGNAGRGNVDHNPANNAARNTDGGAEREYNRDLIEHDFHLGFRAWVLNKIDPDAITEEHTRACRRFGISPRSRELNIRLAPTMQSFEDRQRIFRMKRPEVAYQEARAQSSQIGSLGGYTVAPLFNARIESALLYFGPMMQVATPLRTTTSATYPMPTDNETGATGAYTDENTANTTVDDVSFGVVNFGAYKATSNAVLVPFEVFRDSAIDLNTYIADKLGERLGRFINTQTTTGSNKAKGIVTGATAGVTTASSTAIAMDEVLGLIHSVDIAYRNMPSAAFMFHDNILLSLRKLKDGEGRYLWSNGTAAGEPDLLWGKRYYVNNDMASSIAQAGITMLFGDMSKYIIRTVGNMRVTTTDQRYWEYDQIGFQAYMEFDGNLVDAGTHPVKKLTQV